MRITNFLGENRNSERKRERESVECWLSHKERERENSEEEAKEKKPKKYYFKIIIIYFCIYFFKFGK